jgi:CheY-like chemotaxis protein
MDVQMPTLDGNEATRRIRADLLLKKLPIVALTAGALVAERQRALEAGMNDFISKPFDPQALIRKVRRLVEEARGEPIPMVILDAQLTLGPTGRPKLMPSIDAGIVQQMFGDDLTLFKSLLARLLQEYTDLTIPVCLSAGDETLRAQLTGRAHKLKGSAGMIGATDIMRLAGATEKALNQGRSVDAVEGLLRQLAAALTALSEEARSYSKQQIEWEASTETEAVIHPDAGTAELDELCALLESQNLAALDKFNLISLSLGETLGALRFDRFRNAIENLDFHQGAQLLREARSMGTPTPSQMLPLAAVRE